MSSSPAHPSLNGHRCHILKNNILDFAAGRDKQERLMEKKTNTFRLLSSCAYILWLYWRSQLFTTLAIFSYVPLYNWFDMFLFLIPHIETTTTFRLALFKTTVQYNGPLEAPLNDGPIRTHPELQKHLFNKKLTVYQAYSQESSYAPSSLLMVYAFICTLVSLSSLFNFTFSFRATEIYFTVLVCFVHTVFHFLELHGHI